MNRKDLTYLVPVLLFFLVAVLLSLQLPFFWDTILYSHIANWYLETHFSSLIPPQVLDTGNQPFFELLLAMCWKAFGRTLWVGHLLILPFVLGIVYQFYLLAKRFLPEKLIPAAMLLLAAELTLLAQSTLVSQDIVIVFLYLVGLNSILSKNRGLLPIAAVGLSLSNLRGMSLVVALALTEACMDYPRCSFKKAFSYLPAAAIALGWLLYHKQQTGWMLIQPDEWAEHRKALPIRGILKNLLIIGWRFVDFGKAVIWIVLLWLGFKWIRNKKADPGIKIILISISCPLLVMVLMYAPFSNPIGHRYFLVVYLLFLLLLVYGMQRVRNSVQRIVICSLIVLSLAAGNFLVYPAPYSNGWDSSLAHLFYFKARAEMTSYIVAHRIPPAEVAADFPCNASYRYTDLGDEDLAFSNKYFGGISRYRYVIQSNINNAFQPRELEMLSHWQMVSEFHSGPVFIKLFRNPDLN